MAKRKPPKVERAEQPKKKQERDESGGGLMREIFHEDSGEAMDMTKLDRKVRNWKRKVLWLVIIFLFLAAVAAAVGFAVFNKEPSFVGDRVSLSYTGGTQAVSGEETTVIVSIKNDEAVSLTDVRLEIRYPDSFTYISANFGSLDEYHNTWDLDNILPGRDKALEITGQMVGDIGSSHTFTAVMSYEPSNFSSEFREEITWDVIVTDSSLTLDLTGPQEVIPNQPADYTLTYTNSSRRELERVQIRPNWPEGFTLTSSEPELGFQNAWLFPDLSPGESGDIRLTGTFAGNSGDQKELTFDAGVSRSDGDFNVQVEERMLVLLVEPQLQVDLKVNNEAGPVARNWGDTLSYTLTITNAGDVKLDEGTVNLVLRPYAEGASVEAEYLDWTTLINPENGERDGSTLLWDSEAVEGLSELRPGQVVEFIAEINLISDPPSEVIGLTDLALLATAEYRGQRVSGGEDGVAFTADAAETEVRISSESSLKVEARYFDESGEAVGSGPLPPVVGETTVFKVIWEISNTSSELEVLSVISTLPDGVSWIGQGSVSAGEPLAYNQRDRTITWLINKAPSYVGVTSDPLRAEFSLSFTPQQSQIGEYVLLTEKTVFQARDSFSMASVLISSDAKSTSATDDEFAREKGRVIGQGN
ncbi:MAG: hypothetical protein Q8Q20_04590 [bacterium]|nr:hypothetical protein [bacterium]